MAYKHPKDVVSTTLHFQLGWGGEESLIRRIFYSYHTHPHLHHIKNKKTLELTSGSY